MMISRRLVLFLTGLVFIAASPCFSSHTDITAQQARDLIDSTDRLIILDVREPSEYCGPQGHIPGAVNYPWLSGVLEERYEEIINNEILVVCQSGGRSNQAANFLDSKGYTLVYDMLGGMNVWQWETVPCGVSEDKYSGGKGTADDPYQIATAKDLIALGETPEDYDKHFILTADIDLDPNLPDGKVFGQAVIPEFAGVFDGNDHVIFNLKITGGSYIGLFGQLEEAEVKDLGVVDINIIGLGDYVGSLAGFSNGDISNCYSTGTVAGVGLVGGLVGYSTGKITTSCSNSTVGGQSRIGGLVGHNNEDGAILKCYSTGSVSGNGPVGGLVGQNGIIINVGQEGFFYGGWIDNCYSTCSVTGNTSVGGLVGCNEIGVIIHCYSSGSVFGNENVGGFIGDNKNQVTDCYWDTETSGVLNMCGTNTTEIQCDDTFGKTTAEMMDPNTFISAGWDFVGETVNGPNDIWKIWDGYDYPRLAWEPGPNTPLVFVDINDPNFCGQMSRYEVTNDQYCDFLNAALASGDIALDGNDVYGAGGANSGEDYAGQRYYRCDGSGWTGAGATDGGAARTHYNEGAFSVDEGFGNHPVTYVSWYGAMAFANYYSYYLPTEDQWQAVANYDGTYIYGCGQIIDPGIANYRDSEYPDGTTLVGSVGIYGYGMCDMAGNVSEWTSSGSKSSRIFRGGGWYSYDSDCAVSIRGDGIPYANYSDIGFRVCR